MHQLNSWAKMKRQSFGVLIGICVLLLVVGNTNGRSVEEEKRPSTRNEILTLKSMKAMFAHPRVLGSVFKSRFLQPAIVEDPHCPPGYRRGPTGHCREIW